MKTMYARTPNISRHVSSKVLLSMLPGGSSSEQGVITRERERGRERERERGREREGGREGEGGKERERGRGREGQRSRL